MGESFKTLFSRNASEVLAVDARTGESVTYAQLYADSGRVARYLASLGIKPGDPLAFSLPNCLELTRLYLGAWRLGARIVPINPNMHPREMAQILAVAPASHLVCSPAVLAKLTGQDEHPVSAAPLCLAPSCEPAKASQAHLVNLDLAKTLAGLAPEWAEFPETSDHTALTVFSSGTTAAPKGINLSLPSLVGNARAFVRFHALPCGQRFYNALPMTYLGGLFNLTLLPIVSQGSILLDDSFGMTTMYAFWERVREHRVTALWFNATMITMLMAMRDEEDLSFLPAQVAFAFCGMSPLSPEVKRRFEERFGFMLQENYALSETLFLTSNRAGRRFKPGSVGEALESVRITIVDHDLAPLPTDSEGHIRVDTPFLMQGYERCGASDQANILPDGGFLTGDLGRIDQDGDLFVTGRIKDIIIRGGINISPKVLEDVVYRLDSVDEAAVVGVPHPVYGEEVALAVTLKPGVDQDAALSGLLKHCEENVAYFERPKHVFIIDELPKGVSGKILKNVLRRLVQAKLDPLGG